MAKQSALARTRESVPRVTKTPEALPDLDRLIHERIRLGIISAVTSRGGRVQLSSDNAYNVSVEIPTLGAASITRRTAAAPAR